MRKGYGLFFYESCDSKDRYCNVCGSKMDVEDYYGATSWIGAIGKTRAHCKKVSCPKVNEEWHEQAVEIVMESEDTSSPSLKRILLKDVKDIVHKGLMGK